MQTVLQLKIWKLVLLILIAVSGSLVGQNSIPFEIENNSEFDDSELYVAIVGKDLTVGAHVWVNLTTGAQLPMDPSYNTVAGPQIGGNMGPGGNGMYADCFFKLSDIPNKTVDLLPIQGCRIFIGIKSQLYLYFFGSTGAQQGYASPSHSNPTDPSTGINYEIIELTYNSIGFWGNTSRVDSYNYAMGLELYETGGTVVKTGELLSHADIGTQYLASVPDEFKGCYNATTGQILQPTKTEDFSDGTIGTMPDLGPYRDYMQPYIDEIWSTYTNQDLTFIHPQIGTWQGRVSNGKFTFTCIAGPAGFIGKKGYISGKPNTQEALEGKGVLDERVDLNAENGRYDLMMQAQICAAITRHVIETNVANGTVQNWSDPSKYYLSSPCNHYAKFWHQAGIRVDQLAYGFAYDDVNEQSSTMHSPNPSGFKIVFGGYVPLVAQSPYGGIAHTIPGVIEAEHYDLGGSNVGFSETTTNNLGTSTLRNDAVDLEINGAGHNVGYIATGEWLDYTVDVTETGNYNVHFSVGSEVTGGAFQLFVDDVEVIAATNTPNTSGWSNWEDVYVAGIALTEGEHIITFKAVNEGFNFDKMTFTSNFVSTGEALKLNQLFVYPNPAESTLKIAGVDDISIVKVFNLQGALQLEFNSKELNIGELSSGTYLIQIQTTFGTVTKRFVKR